MKMINVQIKHYQLHLGLGYLLSSVSCSPGIEALAQAGSIIAEKSADYVVDLLCGCGCRFVEQKTCVQEYKEQCEPKLETKCKTKEKEECKDEYKDECKIQYKGIVK